MTSRTPANPEAPPQTLSVEHLRLLVSSLHEHGLYMLDPDGMIISWNDGARRIKRYQADEVIGQNFEIFFTAEDQSAGHPRRELKTAAEHGMMEEEGWRVRKDGSRFWATVVVTALRSPKGDLVGFAKVTRDVSARHEAELVFQLALERATIAETLLLSKNSELETRVIERTQQLMLQSQDLIRTNDELKQFNYIASHDLQEPLRLISAFCGKLSENRLQQFDPDTLEDMQHVIAASTRMKQLILDLLVYGKVQHRMAEFKAMSLDTALVEAMANLVTSIDECHAIIETHGLPALVADYRLMVQLLQNLMGNALKYRGEKPPVIAIQARRKESAWEIVIADNGIGIEPRHQKRVFELFKRLHAADRYSGTGLGLALCKLIVELHGGAIWIESEGAGHGTSVIFSIPDRPQAHVAVLAASTLPAVPPSPPGDATMA